MELSGKNDEAIHPTLTDSGICHVYNGNAMKQTYKTAEVTSGRNSISIMDGRYGERNNYDMMVLK